MTSQELKFNWRLTQALRWLILQFRLARQLGVKFRLKEILKKTLGWSFRKISLFLSVRPVLRSSFLGVLKTIGIYNGAREIFNHLSRNMIAKRDKAPLSEQHLTVRGRVLYRRLKSSAKKFRENQ